VVNEPSPESIRDQLGRIVASPQFLKSPKLSRFLQLIVQEALSGRSGQIKEYSVGVEVYNRPEGYDPRVDATVRVEASKLRKRLSEYYEGEGRNDAVLIAVPKGHYAPVFIDRVAQVTDRPARSSLKRLLLPGLCLAAVAAIGVYRVSFREPSFRLTEHRLISTFPGSHSSASFSPDGAMFAFISQAASGAAQVWIKSLSHDNPVQLTFGDVDSARPRWSPRNDCILFERRGHGIWSVSPLGGPARRIIENGRNANFSPDGNQIVFEKEREIWTAAVDGSREENVAGVPRKVYPTDANPAFSPDGRWIAFFGAEAGPKGDLWVIPSAGGTPRRLTFDVQEGGAPAWSSNGRWIVSSSARSGSVTLWRVPFRGGKPEPVTTGAGDDHDPAISADGTKLIYTNVRNSWSLMLLDTAVSKERELFSSRENVAMPVFSPDGNRIAYFQHKGNDTHLFTVGTDGRGLEQLTKDRGELNIMPSWAEDGASLYFYQMRPSPSFRRLSLFARSSIEVAPWTWGKESMARVDPTGRAAVYTLAEAARPKSTRVRDLATRAEKSLAQAISRPQWSPNGQTILGSVNERQVVSCPADGGPCTLLTAGNRPKWSRDGARIYFLRSTGRPNWFELWSASRDGSDEQRIAELGPFSQAQIHYDISPQGRIVSAPVRQSRGELWLAELR
jgi:Tol biopolymer transport system component